MDTLGFCTQGEAFIRPIKSEIPLLVYVVLPGWGLPWSLLSLGLLQGTMSLHVQL